MSRDKSNIFKLSTAELAKYIQAPFFDCSTALGQIADSLYADLKTFKSPYTLLLEAPYGTGKTFFSTRFTQYLRNKNIETIYFSVWELDYLQDPFLAFSKIIIGFIKSKKDAFESYAQEANEFFDKIIKAIKGISITIPKTPVSYKTEALIDAFAESPDPVTELKDSLERFIQWLPNKKLVIVVDELDRCRPDYAMKTLEYIKHFFDIKGLIVLIPCNQEALENHVKCLYNIDEKSREKYLTKFYNDKRSLFAHTEEEYRHIVQNLIGNLDLSQALEKKRIKKSGSDFNSLNTLIGSLATYSHKYLLTIRQLEHVCSEIVRLCNNFYEPVLCEWLCILMCHKYNSHGSLKGMESMNTIQHPYVNQLRPLFGHNFAPTAGSFLAEYSKLLVVNTNSYRLGSSIAAFLKRMALDLNNFKNQIKEAKQPFKDIFNFIDANIKHCQKEIKEPSREHIVYREEFEKILSELILKLEAARQKIKDVQKKYGLDDHDLKRANLYCKICDNLLIIHSVCKLGKKVYN